MPRRLLVGLGAAALAAIAAAVAFAAIPDSNGVIHGCYSAGGSLRVVNASSECLVTETPLDWSQQGPAGTNGAAGAQGPAGPQGPAGTAGADGADGATGPAGADGLPGVAGAQGPQGPQGPAGPAGADGADGADGVDGVDGVDGLSGPEGPEGPQGPVGPVGPQGSVGPSDAFASSSARAVRVRRALTTLERLDLGTGPHVLLAKIGLSKTATPGTRILCTLAAGMGLDRASVLLPSGPAGSTAHLLLATELSAPGPALVRCRHYAPSSTRVFAAQVQISAIKVGTLTSQ